MKNFASALALTCLVLWSGCTQNEDFDVFDPLSDGEWILVSVLENGVETIEACEEDNVLDIVDESDFTLDFNGTPCDGWEEEIREGTWKLKDDGSTLTFTYWVSVTDRSLDRAKLTSYWEILEVTADSLILQDQLARDNEGDVIVETYVKN